MSDPIINQPWEDVASDVTDAIEKAVQPLLKKATDQIYAGLLDTTQDYLRDNLAFNIGERINAAERQAYADRIEADRLRGVNATLLAGLERLVHDVDDLMDSSTGVTGLHLNGDLAPWSELGEGGQSELWLGEALHQARAAIARATGAGA